MKVRDSVESINGLKSEHRIDNEKTGSMKNATRLRRLGNAVVADFAIELCIQQPRV